MLPLIFTLLTQLPASCFMARHVHHLVTKAWAHHRPPTLCPVSISAHMLLIKPHCCFNCNVILTSVSSSLWSSYFSHCMWHTVNLIQHVVHSQWASASFIMTCWFTPFELWPSRPNLRSIVGFRLSQFWLCMHATLFPLNVVTSSVEAQLTNTGFSSLLSVTVSLYSSPTLLWSLLPVTSSSCFYFPTHKKSFYVWLSSLPLFHLKPCLSVASPSFSPPHSSSSLPPSPLSPP